MIIGHLTLTPILGNAKEIFGAWLGNFIPPETPSLNSQTFGNFFAKVPKGKRHKKQNKKKTPMMVFALHKHISLKKPTFFS